MAFQPQVGDMLTIRGIDYKIAEHPSAPGIPFGQEGRQGIVYQLNPLNRTNQSMALKVFRPKFRMPSLVMQSNSLKQYSRIQGLSACGRMVLTPEEDGAILEKQEELLYSAVMPWIKGPTWADIIAEKKQLTKKESLDSAKSLASVLSQMEQEQLAHCDLSAPNVLLPGLVQEKNQAFVELVDLEQMYSKKMDQPDNLPAGSPGYASHKSIKDGLWSPVSDRFAGSILIIEMLTWFDGEIREHAWGDSYFQPNELQTDSERFERMLGALKENWGEEIVELFTRAWKSQELDQCPTFGEWALKLNKCVINEPSKGGLGWNFGEAKKEAISMPNPGEPNFPVQEELEKAANFEQTGNLVKALETYRNVKQHLDPTDPMAQELQMIISDIAKKLNQESDPVKVNKEESAKVTPPPTKPAPAKEENVTPPPSKNKKEKQKKKKVVPILIMTAIIFLAVAGGGGYAFQEKIPFINKLLGNESTEVASTDIDKEDTEEKEVKTKVAKKENEKSEIVSLWDIANIGSTGEWDSSTSEKIVYLNRGVKNDYISYDLTKLKVGEAELKGVINSTEGIPFQLGFYVDSEEVYMTDTINTGDSVPFEVPIEGGFVLTIKVINNSIEGDDSNKSSFDIEEMLLEITSKKKMPEPEHIESLWTTGIHSYRGEWDTSVDQHTIYVDKGVKNDFVSFDLSQLNIEEAILTGVIVPKSGLSFKLEFYVDSKLVYKTEEIDPKKSGPVPVNVSIKGRELSIKLVNNSVAGDDNQKTTLDLKDLLVNVHKGKKNVSEPSKESLWTRDFSAYKGDWVASYDQHLVYVNRGLNGEFITYDISDVSQNNARIKGALFGEGIPYQLQFKVDDKEVYTTRVINPDTDVPVLFDIPINGSILTVTILSKSVEGDDSKKTNIKIQDFILETN